MREILFEKITILTILSVLLFEVFIALVAFTLCVTLGNVNLFGSNGVLYSMTIVMLMYAIPFVFYKLHVMGMKYILAFVIGFCTIGVFVIIFLLFASISFPINNILFRVLLMKKVSESEYLAIIVIEAIGAMMVVNNCIWYRTIFSK